ncbi:MAG TPA: DUF4384 domain-containing protein, partial [Candidatus Eisenbacteria bacterium]|nr:DUF4384 domain-containing protein [Candidatus Eisenbacteria bacterium]
MHRALLRGLLTVSVLGGLVAAAPAMAHRLDVELWTDRGDNAVYQPGDAMQVKVRTNDDAYLLVYEIDSEGSVHVLFPWKHTSGMVDGRRTYRIPSEDSRYELQVEAATGEGFIVAIASREPFRDLPWYLRPYDPQAASVGYANAPQNEEGFDDQGRVVGDPYVAMERIRRRVLADAADEDGFASSYASYYVHEEVRYPRYLCNDCHRPDYWTWWSGFDPYYTTCSVFDFRVNWNWCWGPPIWQTSVPYYFFVVRNDCPPRFRGWADGRTRWSSWDGWRKWDGLWGGDLRRYKPGTPPPNYVPPQPGDRGPKPGFTPPGYLPVAYKPNGVGERVPIGMNRPSNPADQPEGERPMGRWGSRPTPYRMPARFAPPGDEGSGRVPVGRERPELRPDPMRRDGGDEPPAPRPFRGPARYDPPHRAPSSGDTGPRYQP